MFSNAFLIQLPQLADWAVVMQHDLRDGLLAAGVEAEVVAVSSTDQLAALLERGRRLSDQGRPTFFVDMMARAAVGSAPRFSLVLDHPLTHPSLGGSGPMTVLGLCDRRHMAIEGYSPSPTVFFPHAGPPPDPVARPMAGRTIGILFAGNLGFTPKGPIWNRAVASLPEALRPAFETALERVIETGVDSYEAFVRASLDLGSPLDLPRQTLTAVITGLEVLSQDRHRHRLLNALSGLTGPDGSGPALTVAGEVADDFFADPDGVRLLGRKTFSEIRDLMAEARIVLNITPKFAAGAHERVFHAMSRGAVVAASPSAYLAEDFGDPLSILFLSDPADDRARLDETMQDPARLEAIADQARTAYAAGHTWVRRIERIMLPAMARLAGKDPLS